MNSLDFGRLRTYNDANKKIETVTWVHGDNYSRFLDEINAQILCAGLNDTENYNNGTTSIQYLIQHGLLDSYTLIYMDGVFHMGLGTREINVPSLGGQLLQMGVRAFRSHPSKSVYFNRFSTRYVLPEQAARGLHLGLSHGCLTFNDYNVKLMRAYLNRFIEHSGLRYEQMSDKHVVNGVSQHVVKIFLGD